MIASPATNQPVRATKAQKAHKAQKGTSSLFYVPFVPFVLYVALFVANSSLWPRALRRSSGVGR